MTVIYGSRSTAGGDVSAREVGNETLHWSARVGLSARAFVYLLIGFLAVLVATGHSAKETDQWGAFQQINRGTFGTTARGAVFALAGVFVIQAATEYKPSKAAGLDGALRSLRDTPAGPWLLGVAAIGLIAFGIYGFAEARWRVT